MSDEAARSTKPNGSKAPRPLPEPGSDELKQLLGNREHRVIYELLYRRRSDPPSMHEIRQHVAKTLGEAHEQTDRRLRELRTHFEVPARHVQGKGYVYPLVGWSETERGGRGRVSPKTEAMVYERYGHRCAMCGRSPAEDGVKLVIDHKIPVDWGGTEDPQNLQPLCLEHNHGKQAHFASFDRHKDAIRQALRYDEVHMRIGELLKAMEGEEVPVDLINLVAREQNRGDPTRRLRELRALGWVINAKRRKVGKRTRSYYVLKKWKEWPPEGPRARVSALEAERKRRKKRRDR